MPPKKRAGYIGNPNSVLPLNLAEANAVFDLVSPGQSTTTAEGIAPGVSSLLDRRLVTIEDDRVRLSPHLASVIEPIVTRESSLAVVALTDLDEEDYFFSGERAVRRVAGEGDTNEFEPMPAKKALIAIAARLKAQATAASEIPPPEAVGELAGIAEALGEAEIPKPLSAAGLVLSRPKGKEQIITVLLHDEGFTWIEGGDKARLAYVEKEDELVELLTALIDSEVK